MLRGRAQRRRGSAARPARVGSQAGQLAPDTRLRWEAVAIEVAGEHEHLTALPQALDHARALDLVAAEGDRGVQRGYDEDAHERQR